MFRGRSFLACNVNVAESCVFYYTYHDLCWLLSRSGELNTRRSTKFVKTSGYCHASQKECCGRVSRQQEKHRNIVALKIGLDKTCYVYAYQSKGSCSTQFKIIISRTQIVICLKNLADQLNIPNTKIRILCVSERINLAYTKQKRKNKYRRMKTNLRLH